ncbi:MAG: hypothetical protein NT062_37265, partial [Proteobacteria bacterium]|nr:hypothetical protein [Pseudomonadota bacterium]
CGLALSTRTPWARASLYAARAIAIAFTLAAVFAGVKIATTSLDDSFARSPRAPRRIGDVVLSVPPSWLSTASGVSDPDGMFELEVRNVTAEPAILESWIALEASRVKARGYEVDHVVPQAQRLVPLPAGWEGTELVAVYVDAMDYRQQIRVITCGRTFAGAKILASVYVPESMAEALPGYIAQTLATLGPAE